jgi:primosomal protein N' (replication factor Y)
MSEANQPLAAKVLIDGPSELVFDYAIPENIGEVSVGCRVRIPLRNRNCLPWLLGL